MKKKKKATISPNKQDLQKQVKKNASALEQANHQLRIEALLEKVRARTMAMQKSDELQGVVKVVLDQLKELEIGSGKNITIAIVEFIDDKKDLKFWIANLESPTPTTTVVPWHKHTILGDLWKARKNGVEYFSKVYGFKESSSWWKWALVHTNYRLLPEDRKKWLLQTKNYSHAIAFAKYSGIYIHLNFKKLPSKKEAKSLVRFANVFDQSYIRFLDLQNAEEQARESQIQLALERVRARTMAMQKSDELKHAAALLFQQLKALGVPAYSCGYNIWENDDQSFTSWMSTEDGTIILPVTISLEEDPNFIRFYESRQQGEQFYVIEMRGERMQEHYRYLIDHIAGMGEYFNHAIRAGFAMPETQIHHLANFSHGNLLFITLYPCPEFHDIFKRFAAVFDQTYTRFVDLQKAEAQATESQIQLAMERVRARTMAMQKSDELPEAANLLFQQVQSLGMPAWSAGYCIWDDDKKAITLWMSSEGVLQPPFKAPLTEDPSFIHFLDTYQHGETFSIKEIGGEELVTHYKYMRGLPVVGEILDKIIEAGFPLPTFQIFHAAYFSKGFLLFITYEPVPEAFDIFKRFAKVFEQTYTRFLDLQRAEAQVREAQIESALEKIRSRSLAMHNSNELQEVVRTVFDRLKELDIVTNSTSIFIFKENEKGLEQWVAHAGQDYSTCFHLSYFDFPIFRDLKEAKEKGLDSFTKKYSFQEKNDWFSFAFEHTDYRQIADARKKYLLESNCAVFAYALAKNTGIQVANYEGQLYSESDMDLLKRFSRVFEQAYTRFLDLQKAEIQAREAVKQASVDRVRAEIASMRTTRDLERITPLIWNELMILGVPFIRCGVFILDEQLEQVNTFLSTPDGKAIAAFTSDYSAVSFISEVLPFWRKKEIYQTHWDEAAFLKQAGRLVEQGAIIDGEEYLTKNHPTNLYLNFIPFPQGILYVGNIEPLIDEQLQAIHALADAFSAAYARYEDFNKLESANVKIERTLVDLRQAQSQLVQSEKMASLGELTAGIAHEIQNPLNFVNNFSEVSSELIAEMTSELDKGDIQEAKLIATDIQQNLEKINHHGKRADAIVKGMLQHSRSSGGVKESTDINKLADEYLRLAYHGLRAKDNSFNATLKIDFDGSIGEIKIVPQDIGRVLLNLYNNAFYAVAEKKKQSSNPRASSFVKPPASAKAPVENPVENPVNEFESIVTISTRRINDNVEIIVKDNGSGIPQKIVDKIFQPFFTTKPTGQGTGLGLSLSYDIMKAHGGEIRVETQEGEGTVFVMLLPV